jgi:hypothetical protein
MSGREIQDQKAIAREMFVSTTAHANADVSASPLRGATICSTRSRRDYTLKPTTDEFCEAADTSLLPVIQVDAANLMRVLRQLEVIANDRRRESLVRWRFHFRLVRHLHHRREIRARIYAVSAALSSERSRSGIVCERRAL